MAGLPGVTILTPGAVAFVNALVRRFGSRVQRLLAKREDRQKRLDEGELPCFLADTRAVRESEWRVAPIPADLKDRRVEITGPPERKTVINALNSGARVFMADFEDSLSPTWPNVVHGQFNLFEAVRRTIHLETPAGKHYSLDEKTAVLIVRPRGWHLTERHWLVEGVEAPAALVDFGLYLFHNHAELAKRGSGPYFYLPKLESHLEARLWAEVFAFAEASLHLQQGTIKVTVLIETILAAFEMEETLWELRHYAVALNCGRWDYLFSFIKKFNAHPEVVLPDRAHLTMEAPFMKAYSQLLIKTCHRRGALAMGGMAAQIPVKGDEAANAEAFDKVRADKQREASSGHDGTWVAHPGLVPVAYEVFDRLMPHANNLHVDRADVVVTEVELLRVPEGSITEAGLRNNISVAVQYLAAWLGGNGCVPLNGLMEDAATAEICRAQISNWLRHRKSLSDGRTITLLLVKEWMQAEYERLSATPLGSGLHAKHLKRAAELLWEQVTAKEMPAFLTLAAYQVLMGRA
ncbi:MAG: malate synthase A [Steroidobacteraceae bacterium]